MNLWIVTIGSSDVQLISDETNQAKGRTKNQYSDQVWNDWYTNDLKEDCYYIDFDPKKAFKKKEETYRVAARTLGQVYKVSEESIQAEIWDYLTFPLLDNFVQALQNSPAPEAIVVLLTDQSTIFNNRQQRRLNSPYWQDTCELEPILQRYFVERFPGVSCEFVSLIPQSETESLDNWNAVLDLVRKEFRNLTIEKNPIQIDPEETVYVSHQAGTPAISSAVQFCSLAQFRDNVQFLVSKEDTQTVLPPIPQSTYLGAIRQQEAKALLKRYDYSGVRDLVGLTNTQTTPPAAKRLRYLLNAAEQWNFAEFQKFKKIINDRKLLSQANFPWWRIGYESAYLAWVRLQQGSPVDAMVHSFRAVEGIASLWAEKNYSHYVQRDPKKGLILNYSICNKFGNLTYLFGKVENPKQETGAYGKALFALLKEARKQDLQINSHISIFCKPLDRYYSGNDIFEERNNLFHRLEGLQEHELFAAWDTSDANLWIMRVLGCLNFIAGQNYEFISFEQQEACDEAASLMVKVHEEIERAIEQL
ncbi:MAG: hypothetical protein B0A82_01615 [Alkalinema sp. CACIAM 70d]|nr:MAG: hypothetical protein B0A82_01615 [Alkalinema sp. CACIAM 70d]